MTRHASPGRLLCWLLRAALPGTVIGRSICGDLVEEYHGRQPVVMREGLAFALPGLAIGMLAALAAGGSIADYLYQIDARDPSTLGAALATLTAVVLLASWIPAWRAPRIEPAHALRRE